MAALSLLVGSLIMSSVVHGADNPVPTNISAEAQAYLKKARTGRLPSRDLSDPIMLGRLRSALGNLFLRNAKSIDPDLYLTEVDAGGVRAFWVNGAAPLVPGPVIIYLHGGGHILGSAETNLGSVIRVVEAAGMPVLSVEYRLAPEHPFPADVEDSLLAYRWLLQQGFKANQIGVYGDSAGGGLSLALTLAARDAGLPLPGAVAALSPSADHTGQGDTRVSLVDLDPVLRGSPAGSSVMYAADADRMNPLLSPVYADYSVFPPLLIQVGTREILLSDAVRLARKARGDGADVTLDVWDGMWHVWQDTPDLPEAEAACAALGEFFRRHLTAI